MRQKVMLEWEKTWKNFQGKKLNFLARFYTNLVKDQIYNILQDVKFNKKQKIIDVGCGTGRTIFWFINNGYKNILGIDASKSSINYCKEMGLSEVFLKDAFKTGFKNKYFDLVFSEGLVEHFDNLDVEKLIDEMCRISKNYVLLVQPNRWSLYRKLVNIFYFFIKEKGPPEKDYKLVKFYRDFARNKFFLNEMKTVFLNGFWIMLFEKIED